MVSETHDIANQYEQICEEIMSDCIQPLTGFNQELMTTKKELFAEYKRHCKTLEDMDKDSEKSKLSWERKCRDYEKAKINFDKVKYMYRRDRRFLTKKNFFEKKK